MAPAVPLVQMYNGYSCPILGLGTWKSKPGEVAEAVKEAIDVGYRHIDCAHVYDNEKEVGDAVTAKIQEGVVKREDLFLTSKLWNTAHRPALVEGSVRNTLEKLGVEYLDLYLIHFPQAWKEGEENWPKEADGRYAIASEDFVETWKEMEKLVEKGLTKSIGVSNFNKRQLERLLAAAKIKPAMHQIEVHPYLNNQKLIDYSRAQGMVITAYSPLGSPDRPWAKPGEPNLMDDPRLKIIARKYGKTVPQILIRYAIDRGLIVIPKSVNKTRIAHNFDVLDFQLTPEDLKQIATLECGGRLCDLSDNYHPDYPFNDEY